MKVHETAYSIIVDLVLRCLAKENETLLLQVPPSIEISSDESDSPACTGEDNLMDYDEPVLATKVFVRFF